VNFEHRTILEPLEFRSAQNGTRIVASGVAMRYGAKSKPVLDLSSGRRTPFIEEFRPGAMTKTLSERDITANHEHDTRMYLGRTSAGTLRFTDSTTELRYELDLPDTSAGRDVATLGERGDLKGSSLGFRAIPKSVTWSVDAESGLALRSVGEAMVAHLATTCYPAYDDSTMEMALRSLADDLDADVSKLVEAANRGDLPTLIAPPSGDEATEENEDGRETTVHDHSLDWLT
jgi:HK97 family phage prohead protease